MKLLLSTLLLSAALVPTPACAKDAYDACIESADGSDSAASECARAELARQDARLNAAYEKLMAKLEEPERREKLRAAQRAWIAYRDADANFRHSIANGATLDTLLAVMNTVELTKTRADELESLLMQ